MIEEELEQKSAERIRKVIGGVLVLMAIGALLTVAYLPAAPSKLVYAQCAEVGISRASVDEVLTRVRETPGSRESELEAFYLKYATPRNELRMQACKRAMMSAIEATAK